MILENGYGQPSPDWYRVCLPAITATVQGKAVDTAATYAEPSNRGALFKGKHRVEPFNVGRFSSPQ